MLLKDANCYSRKRLVTQTTSPASLILPRHVTSCTLTALRLAGPAPQRSTVVERQRRKSP